MWCDAKFLLILKSVYHNVGVQDLGLLGCDAVLLGEWLDCLTLEDESTMIHQKTVHHAPSDATLCLRRPESWNQNDFKVFLFFCLTILLSIVWFFVCVLVAINMSLLYMVWKSLHVYTWHVTNNRFWVIAQWLAFYFARTGHKLEFSCGFSTDPDSYRMVN